MRSDKQEIHEVHSTWINAVNAGDLARLLSLMADDVVFLLPGHPPMIGKSAYSAAAKTPSGQKPSRLDGVSEIQEIKVLGEWAFMWTKLSVVITPPGGAPPATRAGHTLSILRKENGKWVLARDANMLAPVSKSGE